MIHVLATIEVTPGQREAFLEAFRQIIPLVRAEPGCLEYGPAVDQPTPLFGNPPPRPDVVVIVEKWSDHAALEVHLKTPHVVAFLGRVSPWIKGLDVRVLNPV